MPERQPDGDEPGPVEQGVEDHRAHTEHDERADEQGPLPR